MKNLQMPHSYISVSEEELRSISGGGPLGDALDLFFSNLRDTFFILNPFSPSREPALTCIIAPNSINSSTCSSCFIT